MIYECGANVNDAFLAGILGYYRLGLWREEPRPLNRSWVRDFFAYGVHTTLRNSERRPLSRVRGVDVSYSGEEINRVLGARQALVCSYEQTLREVENEEFDIGKIGEVISHQGRALQWKGTRKLTCHRENLTAEAKYLQRILIHNVFPSTHETWVRMCNAVLIYCMMLCQPIDFGQIISDTIRDQFGVLAPSYKFLIGERRLAADEFPVPHPLPVATEGGYSMIVPSLITALCRLTRVRTFSYDVQMQKTIMYDFVEDRGAVQSEARGAPRVPERVARDRVPRQQQPQQQQLDMDDLMARMGTMMGTQLQTHRETMRRDWQEDLQAHQEHTRQQFELYGQYQASYQRQLWTTIYPTAEMPYIGSFAGYCAGLQQAGPSGSRPSDPMDDDAPPPSDDLPPY